MTSADPNIVDALIHSGQTVEQLKTRLSELLEQLTLHPDEIVSASTGGGASYSKKERISIGDLVACYRAAIAAMSGESVQSSVVQFGYPVHVVSVH